VFPWGAAEGVAEGAVVGVPAVGVWPCGVLVGVAEGAVVGALVGEAVGVPGVGV
jgi:hypothetical protein